MEEIRATLYFDDTEDLKDVPSLLPPAEYEFEVVEVKSGTAKTGRGRLGLQVKVVKGPDNTEGRKIWDNWNLPDPEKDKRDGRIFKFWKQIAKACPQCVVNEGNGVQRFRPEALIGLHYKGAVSHEEYEGREVQRVNFPYPLAVTAAEVKRPEMFKAPS